MSRSRVPYRNDDEKMLMSKVDEDYEDPLTQYAEKENAPDDALDPYDRIQAEVLDGYTHTGGYLRAPSRGGYIMAPASGGSIPMLAAMIIPEIIAGIIHGISGRGRAKSNLLYTRKPINMTSANNFYKSLYDDAGEQMGYPITQTKFSKLFAGTGYKQFVKNVRGGAATPDKLMHGHLLMPLVVQHLKRALGPKGRHLIEPLLGHAEGLPVMQERVSHGSLMRGGSIMGTLWAGLKNVFGKLSSSDTLKNMGQSAIKGLQQTVTDVTPAAAEALTKYAHRKLKGEDPEISDSELERKHAREIARLRREREMHSELKKHRKSIYEPQHRKSIHEPQHRKPIPRAISPDEISSDDGESPSDSSNSGPKGRTQSTYINKLLAQHKTRNTSTMNPFTGGKSAQAKRRQTNPLTIKKKAIRGGKWVIKLV